MQQNDDDKDRAQTLAELDAQETEHAAMMLARITAHRKGKCDSCGHDLADVNHGCRDCL